MKDLSRSLAEWSFYFEEVNIMRMTEKQKRFCDFYIETGNATQAAIKAGYS